MDKIKTLDIFKWIKNQGVSDNEMLKTFNCGIGFCLIVNKNKIEATKKFFSKKYKPYVIGKIIKGGEKVKFDGKINW